MTPRTPSRNSGSIAITPPCPRACAANKSNQWCQPAQVPRTGETSHHEGGAMFWVAVAAPAVYALAMLAVYLFGPE